MIATSPSLLLVDDDVGFVRAAADIARGDGFHITIAGSVAQARSRLKAGDFDLVLIDLTLPDGSGLDLFDDLDLTTTAAVLITGQPSVDSAIRALKAPVLDYIIKPLDVRHYRKLLADAAARKALPTRPPGQHACGLVGDSPALRDIARQVERVAGSDASVFVHGEPGVGKAAIAAAVHRCSGRSGALVTVRCAAEAGNDLARQLFGHGNEAGSLELAQHGTVFLDDVTHLPVELQASLLRAIERRSIHRIDGDADIALDVRWVVGADHPPGRAIRSAGLREELVDRLSEFVIAVPPLRERPEDIRPLADLALASLNERYAAHKAFSTEAMQQMLRHSWPGNSREVRGAVGRAFLLAKGDVLMDVVEPADASAHHETPSSMTITIGMTLDDIERRMLFKTLAFYDNDKVRAAASLGLSVKTIYNRLARYQSEADGAPHASHAA